MKNFNFINTLNRFKASFDKNKPTIYVITGTVGLVTAGVTACKATLKAQKIVEEHNKKIETIHEAVSYEDPNYTIEDARKETAKTYGSTFMDFAKLYGPSVILGALSVGLILQGNRESQKRNGQLMAAYSSLHEGYKIYRKRVVDRFGKEVDRDIVMGGTPTIIEEEVEDKKGKKKTVTNEVTVIDPENDTLASPYSFFFDASSSEWNKSPEFNKATLLAKQEYWNGQLKRRGRVFLNQILRDLDIPETAAGQMAGWVYDPNNENIDSYIDFGIFDKYDEGNRRFVNGYESVVLLNFNCDGNIWVNM